MGSPAHIVLVALLTLVGCGSEPPRQSTERPPSAADPSSATQEVDPESQASNATSVTDHAPEWLLQILAQGHRADIASLSDHWPADAHDHWPWDLRMQTPN